MLTTASQPVRADFAASRVLQAAAAALAVLWLVAAIAPHDRFDWLLENVLVLAALVAGIATYRRWPLSELSYLLIALFLALHTIGAHYTYSKVPLGFWVQEAMALERNHFDRIVHFSFGLLIAYPVREMLMRWSGATGKWPTLLSFAIMVAASDSYEIAEWLVAMAVSPEAAAAFLGSQGDPFDAQKDVGLAHVGAIAALTCTAIVEKHRTAPRNG